MWGNVQLQNKIVYWVHGSTGEIRMGLPEQYPAPPGFNKVVCNTAHEAELWSGRMRDREFRKQQAEDEEREAIEGPISDNLRKHILHLASNARNNMNRDFLLKHLESYDRRANLTKARRESYLHSEAYERGR